MRGSLAASPYLHTLMLSSRSSRLHQSLERFVPVSGDTMTVTGTASSRVGTSASVSGADSISTTTGGILTRAPVDSGLGGRLAYDARVQQVVVAGPAAVSWMGEHERCTR